MRSCICMCLMMWRCVCCRVDDAEWARYKGLAVPEGADGPKRESRGPAAQEATKQSWSDKIIVSQDMQVRCSRGLGAWGGSLLGKGGRTVASGLGAAAPKRGMPVDRSSKGHAGESRGLGASAAPRVCTIRRGTVITVRLLDLLICLAVPPARAVSGACVGALTAAVLCCVVSCHRC